MSDSPNATILVVDDEVLIRMDLVEMLRAAGYRTCEASSAAQAIEILEQDSDIRVVFTDIQMPGSMDGLALSHAIRERWPPPILVISSGNRTPGQDEMPSETEFLPKPFGNTELRRVLEKVSLRLSAI